MAAISAHGPRTGTIEAYARALETGAEYVEFDIINPTALSYSVGAGGTGGAGGSNGFNGQIQVQEFYD